MATDLNIFLAFGAGFLSFISPCVLPLYPAFISYITGMSIDDLKSDSKRMNRNGMLHTIFFLLGFSVVFVFLGFSTSFVGTFFIQYKDLLRQIGAIFIVLFGLMVIGLFTPKFLMKEHRLQFKNRPAGYLGTASNRTGLFCRVATVYGTNHRSHYWIGSSESWLKYAVYDDVCTRFRNSLFRLVVFHYATWMDPQKQQSNYESRRIYYDCIRLVAIL